MCTVKQRLERGRLKELLAPHPHICSRAYCDPQNEVNLVSRGLVDDNKSMTCHIFICKYGQIHTCDRYTCMAEGVCAVSGLVEHNFQEYADYDKHNAKTWAKPGNNLATAPPPKRLKIDEERIEYIIDTLLYSEERVKICQDLQTTTAKACRKECVNYEKLCALNKVPINMIVLGEIVSRYAKPQPLEILIRDQARIDFYAGVVKHFLRFLPEKVNLDAVVIGTLYCMQQGITIDNIEVLPLDPFLLHNLPLMNDIPRFGLDKKRFTMGQKVLIRLIEQTQKKGQNLHTIAYEGRFIERDV